MKQEDRLREIVGKESGLKVPSDYFDTFRETMMGTLPSHPEKPVHKNLSVWHRVRPYVYLAAMFAGIWCMMNIFHNVSKDQLNADAFHNQLALVANDQETMDFYTEDRSDSDIDLEEEVMNMYSSINELEKDFNSLEDQAAE